MNKFLKITAAVLFFVFVAVSFLLPIETEDIWWHLKAGEYIAQNHQVPFFDPFPFSTEITPWVLTQWGGSLFYYTVHQMFGLDGLRITRVILGLLILAIFFVYSSRKIPYALSLFLTFIIFFPIESRSFLRPDFFNFTFIQIFLIALFAHRDAKTWKPLWTIPLTGIVWVNIHIGSFMYGFLTMGIFLFHYFIQYIQARNAKNETESHDLFRKLEQLGAVTVIYLILFFLTPYGLEGFLYPFKVLFIKDYLEFDAISRSISELLPPIYIFNWFFFWFYLLSAAVLACLAKFKTDRFLFTLLFAFVMYLFLHSVRAGAFFGVMCGYIIAELLGSENFQVKWRSLKFSRALEQGLLSVLILILLVLTVRWINTKVYLNGKTYRYHGNLTKAYSSPEAALNVLADNKINGWVFNAMSYGGYIFWHSYPDLKPFTDSRFSDLPAFFAYMAMQRNPQKAWPIYEGIYPADIVLLQSNRPLAAKVVPYFMNHPEWTLIFIEGDTILFVKKGKFTLPDELANYRENQENKNVILDEINAQIPDYPASENIFTSMKEFFFPAYWYIDREQTAMTLFNIGYKGAALEMMGESLKTLDDIPSRKLLHLMRANLK